MNLRTLEVPQPVAPRVTVAPAVASPTAEDEPSARHASSDKPVIHSDYNEEDAPAVHAAATHATRVFNCNIGTVLALDLNPETFNTENKWKRQMNEFLQRRY